MLITISQTKQLGQIAKLVRKNQGLDQASAGMLSGNGSTFTSEFENGKPTVELGRVLNVLNALGVTLSVDLPIEVESLTKSEQKLLASITLGNE
ncbi:MAG: HTH-type transcriptional regulator/antitoxin HipB [Paraglaciecola sp.]|jgi:HTH-type transcriptional regulator/antitoxin HipB